MARMGRPSKYTDQTVSNAVHYIENYDTEFGDQMPTVAGLALHLDISKETVYEWGRNGKYLHFSDILNRLMAEQERILLNKGLDGTFNSAITKLVLSKHNYSDRQDITTNGQSIKNDWVIMPTSSKEDGGSE